jgi:LemA protein
MKKNTILAIVAVAVILGFYISSKYNNLVTLNNAADTQWAQVNTVLQRRFDGIEQAIGALKVANKNELEAIKMVTDARKIYTAANGDTEAQVAAANNYSGALNGLLLTRATIGEAYPTLKTPDLIGGLVSGVTVEGSENRIAVERQRYNESVQTYNNAVTLFPGNMLAKAFGFTKRSLYQLTDPSAAQAPQIAPNLEF